MPEYLIVNRHNLQTLSLAIKLAIQNATFISIDIEFTGLGDSKKTKSQNIEDRYIALAEVAKTHAITAVGLSLYQKSSTGYIVTNFHFVMLCMKEHTISPSSISFLVEHGFDFNDQYKNGIPYMPGNDVKMENNDIHGNTIFRNIFEDIVNKNCPVVMHNGFLDIIFLYQSFYCELPSSLSVFVADLSLMFKGGLFDTKYISDYIVREKASFLALFERKHEALKARGEKYMDCEIKEAIKHRYELSKLKLHEIGLAPKLLFKFDSTKPFCEGYSLHGCCVDGQKCAKSHDLDIILDYEETHVAPKKRKMNTLSDEELNIKDTPESKNDISKFNGARLDAAVEYQTKGIFKQNHSAAYDAYMTGKCAGGEQKPHIFDSKANAVKDRKEQILKAEPKLYK